MQLVSSSEAALPMQLSLILNPSGKNADLGRWVSLRFGNSGNRLEYLPRAVTPWASGRDAGQEGQVPGLTGASALKPGIGEPEKLAEELGSRGTTPSRPV